MSDIIPENINPSENLTRCIFHHLQYSRSKNKLKPTAFLPPPGRKDVSVLGRDYAPDDTFCKIHCQSIDIPGQTYVGIAVILGQHIAASQEANIDGVPISVQATPLDENNEKIFEETIYITMPGLPMHADVLYEIPAPQKGETSAKHRITARFLCNIACFYLDEDSQSDIWTGAELIWNES